MGEKRTIANLKWKRNLTPTGRPSASPILKGVRYCTFREGTVVEKQQRQWYSQDGEQTYDQVRDWAKGQALQHSLAYTIVLSCKNTDLTDSDFIQVMQGQDQFTDWRLVPHGHTEYRHAHVIVFVDELLHGRQFSGWARSAEDRLEAAERERIKELWQEQHAAEREARRDKHMEMELG